MKLEGPPQQPDEPPRAEPGAVPNQSPEAGRGTVPGETEPASLCVRITEPVSIPASQPIDDGKDADRPAPPREASDSQKAEPDADPATRQPPPATRHPPLWPEP